MKHKRPLTSTVKAPAVSRQFNRHPCPSKAQVKNLSPVKGHRESSRRGNAVKERAHVQGQGPRVKCRPQHVCPSSLPAGKAHPPQLLLTRHAVPAPASSPGPPCLFPSQAEKGMHKEPRPPHPPACSHHLMCRHPTDNLGTAVRITNSVFYFC